MINQPQVLLLKILTTIGYTDDKEEFVKKFIINIQLQAFLDLISTLPTDKQEELKKTLARISTQIDKITRVISSYFSQSQIQSAINTASKNLIKKYIYAISHTLSVQQKKEITKMFQEAFLK